MRRFLKSHLPLVLLMSIISGCFFFRKDKDPEKIVKDWNSVVEDVIEQVDTLEEKAKEIIEEEFQELKVPQDSLIEKDNSIEIT